MTTPPLTASSPENINTLSSEKSNFAPKDLLASAEALRPTLGNQFRDEIVNSLYHEAELIARRSVHQKGDRRYDLDQKIDRIVTSPFFGLPIMLLILALIFWLTIVGANVPSQMLAKALFWIEEQAANLFTAWGLPWWRRG